MRDDEIENSRFYKWAAPTALVEEKKEAQRKAAPLCEKDF